MLFNTLNQAVELGWDFYLPVIIFVVLAALAVPVWASIGVAERGRSCYAIRQGRFWISNRSCLRHVCGDFRLGRRRRRRRGADDHRSVGREWLSASLCLRSRCRRGLHRDLNSTLHCLYYYWSGAGYIRLNLIFSCADPRIADLNRHPDHQSRCQ